MTATMTAKTTVTMGSGGRDRSIFIHVHAISYRLLEYDEKYSKVLG
jgi:hypothetical protein